MKRRTIFVRGLVVCVQGRFVCWNSFKGQWFLGPRRLSEIFAWKLFGQVDPRLDRVLKLYPLAEIRYEQDKRA